MDLNYTAAARLLGTAVAIFGGAMLLPAITAYIYKEPACLSTFLLTALCCGVAGLLIALFCKPRNHRMMIREGFLIVSLFYLIMSFLGAIPMYACGTFESYFDAFFEAVSAMTSTGATLIEYPESAFRSVILWRSLMQWLGSLAILLFSTVLFSNLGLSASELSAYESPVPRLRELTPKLKSIGSFLLSFYTGATILEMLMLRVGLVGRFDCVIYSLSSISNGGFASHSDSVASLGIAAGTSEYVQFVLMLFMIIGSLNFLLYYKAFREGSSVVFKDEETKCYLLIIAATALLVGFDLVSLSGRGSYVNSTTEMNLLSGLFHVVSIATTTGMTTTGFSLWPTFCKLILLGLMLSGSCSLSFGGGAKCVRTMIAVKYVHRGIAVRLHPNAVVPIKISERKIPSDNVIAVLNFLLLYIATIFIGTLLISLDGANFTSSLSSVISCLGNVGPAFTSGGHELLYLGTSAWAKLLLEALMIAGRLEIFAFFMLFSNRFWNPN